MATHKWVTITEHEKKSLNCTPGIKKKIKAGVHIWLYKREPQLAVPCSNNQLIEGVPLAVGKPNPQSK